MEEKSSSCFLGLVYFIQNNRNKLWWFWKNINIRTLNNSNRQHIRYTLIPYTIQTIRIFPICNHFGKNRYFAKPNPRTRTTQNIAIKKIAVEVTDTTCISATLFQIWKSIKWELVNYLLFVLRKISNQVHYNLIKSVKV